MSKQKIYLKSVEEAKEKYLEIAEGYFANPSDASDYAEAIAGQNLWSAFRSMDNIPHEKFSSYHGQGTLPERVQDVFETLTHVYETFDETGIHDVLSDKALSILDDTSHADSRYAANFVKFLQNDYLMSEVMWVKNFNSVVPESALDNFTNKLYSNFTHVRFQMGW